MITSPANESYFDKVVQNLLQPAGLVCRFLVCLSVCLITSCTIWPEPSERVLSLSERRVEIPPELDHDYLTSLLEISKARLGYIIEGGAEFCIPGQVKKIRKELLLARQEIDGNLLLDAQISIVRSIDQLDYSVQLMKSLFETTECFSEYSRSEEDVDQGYKLVNELAAILNCECEQLDDESVLTKSFEKRLARVADVLDMHPEMILTVYSMRDETVLEGVVGFLKSRGVRKEQYLTNKTSDQAVIAGGNTLGFELQVAVDSKYFELKSWRDSVIIKSSIIRR
ncbi:MAG: hypothetical protein ACR2PT_18330 [Endozoicomonas sp.]